MPKVFLPHQEKGFKKLINRDTIAVFWQMRLGKTLLAIRWAESKPVSKILVVAPLSVLQTWYEELEDEGIESVLLTGTPEERFEKAHADVKWCLLNYEGLQLRGKGNRHYPAPSDVALLDWDMVILDESTRIRKPKSSVTRIANTFLARAPFRAILSGLPNPEDSTDYFEQMRFAFRHFLGQKNWFSFQKRYYKPIDSNGWEWIPRNGTLAKIKENVNRWANVLTRKQAGFYTKKVPTKRYVELPPALKKKYDKLEEDYVLGDDVTQYAVVKRVWCQRLAGGFHPDPKLQSNHKVNELLYLLQEELSREQVVVFFKFNAEIQGVRKALSKAGISHTVITGQTGVSLRAKRRRAFQRREYRVVLCQSRCVRYGLDFSAASVCIFFSNWDEYELRGQAEDRIISVLKNEPCLYIDLITRDTVDEDVITALSQKGVSSKYFQMKLRTELLKRVEKRHAKKVTRKRKPTRC